MQMEHTPKQRNAGSAVVVCKTDGNPEGKGSSGLLADWERSEPRGVVAKPQRQVLAELFTSMLVLSASFRYRPAVGAPNFLYYIDDHWSLSLIAPDEWSAERQAGFVGTCTLETDMTWTIAPSDRLADNTAAAAALVRFHAGFARMLDTDLALEDILPFHVARLPYHQRLYASALGRSLRATVTLGGQAATACRDWRMLLLQQESPLLASGN